MSNILMCEAESLVPVKRAALYRHAKRGDFSTSKDTRGRMTVDIAELERFYGHLHHNGNGRQHETPNIDEDGQVETPENVENGHHESKIQTQVVIELLQEQLADTKPKLSDAKEIEGQLLSMLKTEQEKTKMLMLPKPKKRFRWLGYLRFNR